MSKHIFDPAVLARLADTVYSGTKLGKNLGGAKQQQLIRKEVQQISAPPTSTSTAEISNGGSTGLRLLASGRGGWSPPSPTAGSVLGSF